MKPLLKFVTCGSVDDGKSTLIGHMLYDAKILFTDQQKALELDSQVGSREGNIDYSLLLDGLMAEREQGITIDVAYRFFTTEKRSFIVADCPGHEQYTRNMAVGASFADVALLLVDATQGVVSQTKRHAYICSLLGIQHMIIAVNKMDLLAYDVHRFQQIEQDLQQLLSSFSLQTLHIIPVSATEGDNITEISPHTPWYQKQPLLTLLEELDVTSSSNSQEAVLPIQRVCRPNHTFRGFQGQLEEGTLAVGDKITMLPSKEQANVTHIYVGDESVQTVTTGQPVTFQLDTEIDASRGCVATQKDSITTADACAVTMLWMDEQPLIPGRNYWLQCGTNRIPASITKLKYKRNIHTLQKEPVKKLFKNELAEAEIVFSEAIPLDTFASTPSLGRCILIDRITHATAACATILYPLRRATNITWHATQVTRTIRSNQKNQHPCTFWFTGLSGSGKSTLANALEQSLVTLGYHTMLLDGDNVRHGLNQNLGFTEPDRVENIRRIAEVAKLLNDAGLVVCTSFISPYAQDRQRAKEIIGSDYFYEVHVSTPLEVCEQRDVKGLYKKARAGAIPNFTGISSPYQPPTNPFFSIDTSTCTVEEAIEELLKKVKGFEKK